MFQAAACARGAMRESTDHGNVEPDTGGLSASQVRKQRRLRLRSEFEYVKKAGRKAVGRYLVLQAAPARDGLGRWAIVVSRYFSPRAVDRNRARRIIRVAFREALTDSEQPEWLVIRPRQPIKSAKSQQVARELRHLLRRLGICEGADERKGSKL